MEVDNASSRSLRGKRYDNRRYDNEARRFKDSEPSNKTHRERDHAKKHQNKARLNNHYTGDDYTRTHRGSERQNSKKRSRSRSPHERPQKRSKHSGDMTLTSHSRYPRSSTRREELNRDSTQQNELIVKEQEKAEEAFKQRVEAQLKHVTAENDEERVIRERRERRQAILAKYNKTSDDQAKSPDTRTLPLATAQPATIDLNIEREAATEERSSLVGEQTGAVPAHEISSDELQGEFEQTKKEDEAGLDMFAEEDEIVLMDRMHRGHKEKPLDIIRGVDPLLDEHGYYKHQIGDLLHGRYRINGSLGKGVFGTVLAALDEATGQHVAIKLLRSIDAVLESGRNERLILNQLNNDDPEGRFNVVKLLGHFEEKDRLGLVFEPLEMNLRQLVKKYGSGVGLSIKVVQVYAFKLFKALVLLKRNNVVHGDLKPDNILVKEKSVIRLADFGCAHTQSVTSHRGIAGEFGTPYYRAPENILGCESSFPIDVFALGCTLYELACGKFMFPSKQNNNRLKIIMETKGKIPKKMLQKGTLTSLHFDDRLNFKEWVHDPVTDTVFDKIHASIKQSRSIQADLLSSYKNQISTQERKSVTLLADLLEKCTVINPNKRITPEEALRHPFFQKEG